ncbi:MAG: hypothetical protein P8Z49_03395 [Acidobacteriota bacterium]
MRQRRWKSIFFTVLLGLVLTSLLGCAALKRDIKPGYPAVNSSGRPSASRDAD